MKNWRPSPQARFDANYVVDDAGCWIWQGALVKGYGQIRVDGKRPYAHVYSWERKNGPVPDGFEWPSGLASWRGDARAPAWPVRIHG